MYIDIKLIYKTYTVQVIFAIDIRVPNTYYILYRMTNDDRKELIPRRKYTIYYKLKLKTENKLFFSYGVFKTFNNCFGSHNTIFRLLISIKIRLNVENNWWAWQWIETFKRSYKIIL